MYYINFLHSGDKDAVSRIAYELCEDCAKHRIRYMEVRYCPQLFANAGVKNEYAHTNASCDEGTFKPRDVVVAVNEALERGMKEFNVIVKTILCCMTHKPGGSTLCVASLFSVAYLGNHCTN